MKKLFTGLLLLTSLSTYASETQTVTGIVRQLECDGRSNLGIVEILTKKNKTLISTWYKVTNTNLCKASTTSPFFLGPTSILGQLSAENNGILSDYGNLSTLVVEGDQVVDIDDNEEIFLSEFYKNLEYFNDTNQREMSKWYFREIKGFDTSNWP